MSSSGAFPPSRGEVRGKKYARRSGEQRLELGELGLEILLARHRLADSLGDEVAELRLHPVHRDLRGGLRQARLRGDGGVVRLLEVQVERLQVGPVPLELREGVLPEAAR